MDWQTVNNRPLNHNSRYYNMTVKQLRDLAKEREIPGRSNFVLKQNLIKLHDTYDEIQNQPSTVNIPKSPPTVNVPKSPLIIPTVNVPKSPPRVPTVNGPKSPLIIPTVNVPKSPLIIPTVNVPKSPLIIPTVNVPKSPPRVPTVNVPKSPPRVPIIQNQGLIIGDNYNNMTVKQLKEIMGQRNMSGGGTKMEIINELQEYDRKEAELRALDPRMADVLFAKLIPGTKGTYRIGGDKSGFTIKEVLDNGKTLVIQYGHGIRDETITRRKNGEFVPIDRKSGKFPGSYEFGHSMNYQDPRY